MEKTLLLIIILYLLRYLLFFFVMALPIRVYNILERKRFEKRKLLKLNLRQQTDNKKTRSSLLGFFKQNILRLLISSQKLLIHKTKNIPSHIIRNFIYKNILLVKRGRKSIIYFGCEIRAGYNLYIGEGTIVGDNCILDARDGIDIGDNVNISSEVRLWTGSHDINSPYFGYKGNNIVIGNRAWISSNAIILGGVKIGEGAVVCANAVVTKDVKPFTIVAGVPAKPIGERSQDLQYMFHNRGYFL